MGRLEITPLLKGDLGELYFRHLCLQNHYAYVRPETIYKSFTPQNELEFKFGFDRIRIHVPDEIANEVRRICRPSEIAGSKRYVFDFLTCKLDKDYVRTANVIHRDVKHFNWVEVKSNTGHLTRNQMEKSLTCKIPFNVFSIKDVMQSPENVWITWI